MMFAGAGIMLLGIFVGALIMLVAWGVKNPPEE